MLRASIGKVVHTVQRAGTFAAKVSPQELHKIAVHVRAVPLPTDFYSNPLPPLSKSGFKLVFNVNNVYGNLKSENSQDYMLRNLNEIVCS
jgi:hypothetical protein